MKVFFWILIFIVFYTYVGYGLIIWLFVKIRERCKTAQNHSRGFLNVYDNVALLPKVTVFIAAYNEEAIVMQKIQNCNAFAYPKDRLNILWVTDGSNDKTVDMLQQYITEHHEVNMQVEHSPERKGKAAAFNRGIRFVKTPIVIFTDANTMVNRDGVMEIVKAFANPKVGCV